MSKEIDAAVELLKGAIRREQNFPVVEHFMGLSPLQIHKLKVFYEQMTGIRPEDII